MDEKKLLFVLKFHLDNIKNIAENNEKEIKKLKKEIEELRYENKKLRFENAELLEKIF